MKKTVLISTCAAAFCIGGWFLFSEEQTPEQITLYGNIDIRQVDISFKVSGTINSMIFEEGDEVKAGDLLATLDDTDYVLSYQKALSEVERCKAKMDEAISVLETNLPLCKQKISSERSCISYTNAKNEAVAAYETAKIAAEYQKKQLDYTKIFAPSDGIISSRIVEPGTTVASGQPLYTITKTEPLWVRVYLPEIYLGNVDYGSRAVILTDSVDPKTGQKKHYRGHIGYISPIAEFTPKSVQTEELRTDLVYRLNIYVDENDGGLKQGMPVTVHLLKIAPETKHGRRKLRRNKGFDQKF